MGLFNFRKKAESKLTQANKESVFQNAKISLEKTIINLEKKDNINFTNHQAQVVLALDFSGSMRNLYLNGEVQTVLTRLIPLALRFDDDGQIEIRLFDNNSREPKNMNLDNYETFVEYLIQNYGLPEIGTAYAPVLKDIFLAHRNSKAPVFVIFITDGDNMDKALTTNIIYDLAKENIFIQFVGIGKENFSYLEALDNLSGRESDNTGFFKAEDLNNLSDEDMFTLLLDQYPEWLKTKNLC